MILTCHLLANQLQEGAVCPGYGYRHLGSEESLADWNRFWGVKDPAAVRVEIRYRGGALHSRAVIQLESVTAEDFRLQAGSSGHRRASRDLGADVDLVGPGAVYERWKNTPAYQQWLKDTGESAARSCGATVRDSSPRRQGRTDVCPLAEGVAAAASGADPFTIVRCADGVQWLFSDCGCGVIHWFDLIVFVLVVTAALPLRSVL